MGVAIFIPLMILPRLLLAIWSMSLYRLDCLKLILSHPSILFIPVFTNFTFTNSLQCCYCIMDSEDDKEVSIFLSPLMTGVNMFLTIGGFGFFYIATGISFDDNIGLMGSIESILLYLNILLTIVLKISFMSPMDCLPDLQRGVLKMEDPLAEFVFADDDDDEIINFLLNTQVNGVATVVPRENPKSVDQAEEMDSLA